MRQFGPILVAALLGVASGVLADAAFAASFTACTVSDIIKNDPTNCPNDPTKPCSIRATVSLPAANTDCNFDFGSRDVSIGGSSAPAGSLVFHSESVELEANSLTIFPNGRMDGSANTASGSGGMLTITTTGNITFPTASTKAIDVSGSSQAGNSSMGGTVSITAGGNVQVGGEIDASANQTGAGGGTVEINAIGDIVISALITTASGSGSSSSGEIDLCADGQVNMIPPSTGVPGGQLNIQGSDGGCVNVDAGTSATIQSINGNGAGDGGAGGAVNITANTLIQMNGAVNLNGANSADGGGCGGLACIESTFGGVTFNADTFANGGTPDGAAGEVDVTSLGDILIQGTASNTTFISVDGGTGACSCGGTICLDSNRDITIASTGSLSGSGGADGGDIELDAGRNMTFHGKVDGTASAIGGFGGTLCADACEQTSGSLIVDATLDVSGTGGSGSGGGATTVTSCNLTVTSNGALRGRGSDGGELTLTSREVLTINGAVNFSKTSSAGMEGSVILTYPTSIPQPTPAIAIAPAPTAEPEPLCMNVSNGACLIPCPVCGNGVVEFPETCDLGVIPPAGCSQGNCDADCQVEDPTCNDNLVCTTDSCDPQLGCINLPVNFPCSEPTSTPTLTAIPTSTPTIPTSTATPTVTLTPTFIPTPVGGGCLGDCNHNGTVTASELGHTINLINLCGGSAVGCAAVPSTPQECFAADKNANGSISAGELTAIVGNLIQFANGCSQNPSPSPTITRP